MHTAFPVECIKSRQAKSRYTEFIRCSGSTTCLGNYKVNMSLATTKVSITGVVALWGDCMPFPSDQGLFYSDFCAMYLDFSQ